MRRLLLALLLTFWSALAFAGDDSVQPQSAMQLDVARLVEAARKLDTLWPWQRAIPEVSQVARYGKAVAPILVALLSDDPDMIKDSTPEDDWHVQQHVALTLCKIYGISEESGHVYDNRAMPEENSGVKKFWLRKLATK